MNFIFGLFCLSFSLCSISQNENVEYFKNLYLTKVAKESKAKFSKKTVKDNNGITHIIITDLRINRVLEEQHYRDDRPVGKWKQLDISGKVINEIDFSNLVYFDSNKGFCDSDSLTEDSAGVVMPVIKTEDGKTFSFLMDQMQYPGYAREREIQGTVIMGFKVNKEGKVVDVSILKTAHPVLDFEASRVITALPDWSIGTKNGEPMKFCFVLPLRFQLR